MADKVEVQMPDGRWEIKISEDISEEELNYPMRCCWKNKNGQSCHAPMVPVHHQKPYPHISFRQKNGENVHILGCKYDERREKETITYPDYRACDRVPVDLWKAMEKNKKVKGKGKGRGGPTEGPNGGDEEPGGIEPSARPIQRRATLPKSPESLAEILMDLPIDAEFANTSVGDLIVDQRTVDRLRYEGIPDDAYVLVLTNKLALANRTFVANKGEIVLVDCKYDASIEAAPIGCIQFRLPVHGEAKTRMFDYLKLKGDNTYIVIFSRWKRDPDNANTYIAIDADVDHIGRIRLPDSDAQ